MTLAEKAGAMMHGNMVLDRANAHVDIDAMKPLVLDKHVNTFITRLSSGAATLAGESNRLQAMAAVEKQRSDTPHE
jgi:beta-glucosidase